MRFCPVVAVVILATGVFTARAADPGTELNDLLDQQTDGRFKLMFEFRTRLETRDDNNFGRSVNLENPLFRTRIGAQFDVTDWLRLSATGQDSRAPQFGGPAPNSARDTLDLHEAYVELFAEQKGFGAIVGRQSFNLGEGRLIGVPQWRNTSRTYDTARAYHRWDSVRLEFLFLSLVNVLPDDFNKPRLGDRLWGTYSTFLRLIPKAVVDLYVLRRDENRPGGFTGPGTLGINTFGGRAAGSLPWSLKYSTEEAVQTGHTGLKQHRGFAAFGNVSRVFGRVSASIEYKYASGDHGNNAGRETTFDQLYAANHDKFGHADLLGWRNLHNLRSLETVRITKRLAGNFMYDNWWLASATDALYDGLGRAIVRSPSGAAGRHVGQEFDLFATYQASGGLQFGGGVARVVAGEFLKKTTPHPNTTYFYIFQSYTF
jgi:hypothetical protein